MKYAMIIALLLPLYGMAEISVEAQNSASEVANSSQELNLSDSNQDSFFYAYGYPYFGGVYYPYFYSSYYYAPYYYSSYVPCYNSSYVMGNGAPEGANEAAEMPRHNNRDYQDMNNMPKYHHDHEHMKFNKHHHPAMKKHAAMHDAHEPQEHDME
jgi:hypothetical protein